MNYRISRVQVPEFAKLPSGQVATQAPALRFCPAEQVVHWDSEVHTSQPAPQAMSSEVYLTRAHASSAVELARAAGGG